MQHMAGFRRIAEREGFEPSIPQKGIPVFETGAFSQALPPLRLDLFLKQPLDGPFRGHNDTPGATRIQKS